MEAVQGIFATRSKEAEELERKFKSYVLRVDGESKDHGIETGYRYNGSPVIFQRGAGILGR
jgi:FAD-dependent monooxygenase